MKFIEMSGRTLSDVMKPGELDPEELVSSGVGDESIVRINQQGDIEVRRRSGWDVIGGLLGDFEERIKRKTGLDWA